MHRVIGRMYRAKRNRAVIRPPGYGHPRVRHHVWPGRNERAKAESLRVSVLYFAESNVFLPTCKAGGASVAETRPIAERSATRFRLLSYSPARRTAAIDLDV